MGERAERKVGVAGGRVHRPRRYTAPPAGWTSHQRANGTPRAGGRPLTRPLRPLTRFEGVFIGLWCPIT